MSLHQHAYAIEFSIATPIGPTFEIMRYTSAGTEYYTPQADLQSTNPAYQEFSNNLMLARCMNIR